MKTSIKVWLVIIALALLACFAVLRLRPDEPVVTRVSDPAQGPSFEVQVEKPRMARPLFGLIPSQLEKKLAGHGELRFNQESGGAKVGSAGYDRLELGADGWELSIRTDSEGRIVPGTRLVFPIKLAERQRTLRCRPADVRPAISTPARGPAPANWTATSSSNLPSAKMPTPERSSNGHHDRSPFAGASEHCHQDPINPQLNDSPLWNEPSLILNFFSDISTRFISIDSN